jgi:hypothetical protein
MKKEKKMADDKSTSWAPTAKVSVGVLAGAITLLALRIIQHYVHVDVSADTSSALTSVLTFVIQYMTPERK